jgi:hypothetical protein
VKDVAQLLLQSIEFHPDSTVAKNGNGNGQEYPSTQEVEEMSGTPAGPSDPQTT